MRFIIALIGCVLVAGYVPAGQPNKLTQKEIREGWLSLFDGETTFGWDGPVEVKFGVLRLRSNKGKATMTFTTRFPKSELVTVTHGFGNTAPRYLTTKTIIAANEPIRFEALGNSERAFRSIKLRPVETEPIFNGKNLDGWKVLPGYKSKYTVTKEGWLNVKDGRGDIQTTKSYKNFMLQLECISHGKHLNSGIFFRCVPGQYQQGYEAQIRNESTPGKDREYKLNKYNPKTHEKLGTYTVKSTAVDYGTGGIYRRMPARAVYSKDKEWFTMTVVANRNHFATWVNGIQAADWSDHRPFDQNARRGCCLNAGVISIQGHDPTTNLSFRNFRIAEYSNR